jgi:hypothetical protein
LAELQEAQSMALKPLNTGQAVIIDIGRRLARIALGKHMEEKSRPQDWFTRARKSRAAR